MLYGGIVIVCLFMIALPILLSLAFPWGLGLGLMGMWYGMPAAYVLLNCALFCAHQFMRDWQKYSDRVVERERLTRLAYDEGANALAGGASGTGSGNPFFRESPADVGSERLVPGDGSSAGADHGSAAVALAPVKSVAAPLPVVSAGASAWPRRSRGESAEP